MREYLQGIWQSQSQGVQGHSPLRVTVVLGAGLDMQCDVTVRERYAFLSFLFHSNFFFFEIILNSDNFW